MKLASMRTIFLYASVGILVPGIFLLNALYIPEPYSQPLRFVAKLPLYIMPFFENDNLMRELTLLVFGKMTSTYLPIKVITLILFWGLFAMLLLLIGRYFLKKAST